MQRLRGMDASFLYFETPSQPLHVSSIFELDTSTVPGGHGFDRFRDELRTRIKSVPELRQKLVDHRLNLDYPVWVEDDSFDIDRHLNRIALPAPGGRRELSEVCGHIASLPLDRERPLWEMWAIEKLADGSAPSERLAVMIKVHHASIDGAGATDLLMKLCDTQPSASPPEPAECPGGAGVVELAVDGLMKFAARPFQLATLVPKTASVVVDIVRRALSGRAMTAPFRAPRTPFNDSITRRRNIAYAQLELDDVRIIKNRLGVKMNDVVMALCSSVLRTYLDDRGALPTTPLVAAVPVSVRERCDRPERNQVSAMLSRLETHIADPLERLQAIAYANVIAKEHNSALGPTLLLDWAQLAVRTLSGPAMRLYASSGLAKRPIHNLVISNVPGPPFPLYLVGCEVKAMYPLGPIFHGAGLNITVLSLNHRLNIGIASCWDLVPDVWDLADRFDAALHELLAATA